MRFRYVVQPRFSKESRCLFLLILEDLSHSEFAVVNVEVWESFCTDTSSFLLCCVLLVAWAICGRSRNSEVFQALDGSLLDAASTPLPIFLPSIRSTKDQGNYRHGQSCIGPCFVCFFSFTEWLTMLVVLLYIGVCVTSVELVENFASSKSSNSVQMLLSQVGKRDWALRNAGEAGSWDCVGIFTFGLWHQSVLFHASVSPPISSNLYESKGWADQQRLGATCDEELIELHPLRLPISLLRRTLLSLSTRIFTRVWKDAQGGLMEVLREWMKRLLLSNWQRWNS